MSYLTVVQLNEAMSCKKAHVVCILGKESVTVVDKGNESGLQTNKRDRVQIKDAEELCESRYRTRNWLDSPCHRTSLKAHSPPGADPLQDTQCV